MLNYYKTDDLQGKISSSILNEYKMDYKNLLLSSIVAGFHRTYGSRDVGISMARDIVNTINDYTENLWERNLLVWNLYILARDFIDDGEYEYALNYAERAEKNWSRDVILGDDIGVYHVSWIEQIWLRKAEIYLLTSQIGKFEETTDKILSERFKFFKYAEGITGERILKDRCTYSCFELMSLQKRKENIDIAVRMIKKAIFYKGGSPDEPIFIIAKENEDRGMLNKAYDLYVKLYYSLQETPYDNISCGYCKTCFEFDGEHYCNKFGISTDFFKACTHYTH